MASPCNAVTVRSFPTSICPNEVDSVPAMDAVWVPGQDAIEQDEAVTAAYDQKQRVAEAESKGNVTPAE